LRKINLDLLIHKFYMMLFGIVAWLLVI
jgi:hypothetical protein